MRRSSSLAAQSQQGFSYLWVLLLIAFMGVGLTVAAEIDSTAAQRDKEKELLSIGRQFRTAIGRYYETQTASGKKEYPLALDDLLRDARVPGVSRHLRKVFVDPITAKDEWGLVRIGGRIVGIHSLSDKTPIKQEGFEADEMSFRGQKKYSDWTFFYPADLMLQIEAGANPALGIVKKPDGSLPSGNAKP